MLYTFTFRGTRENNRRIARGGLRRIARFERIASPESPRSGAKSETGICNLALSLIGAGTIISIDDADPKARTCKLFYHRLRKSLLRSHPWNFAIRRETLTPEVVPRGTAWAFHLPIDCLRVLEVNGKDQFHAPAHWVVEARDLVCHAENAQIRYIANVEDVNEFDPLFIETLYEQLAREVSEILIGEKNLVTRAGNMARLADEWESRPRNIPAWELSGMVQRRVPVARGGINRGGGTVGIPLSSRRENAVNRELQEVQEILITSQGPQDDDLRIQINGISVSDTQMNVAWYFGENQVFFPPNIGTQNSLWNSAGFRKIRLSGEQVRQKIGRLPRRGDVVTVDTFDGWSTGYRKSKWLADVTFVSGIVRSFSGGENFSGTGSGPPVPTPIGNYFTTGPHFVSHYPNGGFTI